MRLSRFVKLFVALLALCLALSACGVAYTWLQRSAQAQIACFSGMLLDPARGCWAARRMGDEAWQASWP